MSATILDSLSSDARAVARSRPRAYPAPSTGGLQAESPEPSMMLMGMPLLRMFDRMGCGGLILSASGHVMARNTEAARILTEMGGSGGGEAGIATGRGRTILNQLLGHGKARVRLDSEDWILIEREGRRPLIMSVVPVPVLGESGMRTVLMLIDLESAPLPNHDALKRIFGLTLAESRLAICLAQGATLAEAAKTHGVSVGTVRTQLSAIFAKTHTRRQAELMILITRLVALG